MSIPTRNSDPANILANSRTFFVTTSTFGKRALLQSEHTASLLIRVLHHYRNESKYLLHAFVVMPDHIHILITVDSRMTVEKAVQFIKGGFSFRANKELGLRGELWQRGFSELRVESLEQFRACQAYIHNNPVRRHLCESPAEFAYSSAGGGMIDGVSQGLTPARSFDSARHG